MIARCDSEIGSHEEDPAMPTSAPPFRADHVGSLLRPVEIKEARARNAEGKLGQAEFAAIEDEAIKRIIARQEEIGSRPSPTASSAAPPGIGTSWAASKVSSPRPHPPGSASRARLRR
jgi:hypothetical protein